MRKKIAILLFFLGICIIIWAPSIAKCLTDGDFGRNDVSRNFPQYNIYTYMHYESTKIIGLMITLSPLIYKSAKDILKNDD